MGIEYNIRCKLPEKSKAEEILSSLHNPTDENGWTAFNVSVEAEGYYFCDNGKSDASDRALRQLIDAALLYSDSVTIDEP
ncbi:MAG: hypothetical protein COA78_01385 [Blastopirellula sp.]|nr:MAG: hypothetical protein COA78_01385 [Blastopirellula sp.]